MDGSGVKRIYIQWQDGLLLFCGYIAYVLVCAYYEPIKLFMNAIFNFEKESVADTERPLSPVADMVSEVRMLLLCVKGCYVLLSILLILV